MVYCVVGGGIIGSWTALHLQRAGKKTVLIEQFPGPHTRGSSHGASRVFRFLGDDDLSALEYSLTQWHELEDPHKEPLFIKTGLLNFGTEDDAYLRKYYDIVTKHGRPAKWLTAKEVAAKYPHISYPNEWAAVFDPNGGVLLAHKCVAAIQAKFVALGGEIVEAQVTAIVDLQGNHAAAAAAAAATSVKKKEQKNRRKKSAKQTRGAIVQMQKLSGEVVQQCYTKVVVCAGPWTSKLLPNLAPLLTVERVPVTYWRTKPGTPAAPGPVGVAAGEPRKGGAGAGPAVSDACAGAYSVAANFPVIFNSRLTNVYGLPEYEYPGLVKILYHGGPEVDPDQRDVLSSNAAGIAVGAGEAAGVGPGAAATAPAALAVEPTSHCTPPPPSSSAPPSAPSSSPPLTPSPPPATASVMAALQPYIDHVSRYVATHFPYLESSAPAILEPCMYTVTPDHYPIMDALHPSGAVVVGCGYSGSGFKHSPASGRMLAAIAMDKVDELPGQLQLQLQNRYTLLRFAQRLQEHAAQQRSKL